MKKIPIIFGGAFIIALSSAFATKDMNSKVDNPYWLRSNCSSFTSLPSGSLNGNKVCTKNGEIIYQGATCQDSQEVDLHQ